jgi:hypothetical protein
MKRQTQIPSGHRAYGLYIPGEIDRRSFFDRVNKVARLRGRRNGQ